MRPLPRLIASTAAAVVVIACLAAGGAHAEDAPAPDPAATSSPAAAGGQQPPAAEPGVAPSEAAPLAAQVPAPEPTLTPITESDATALTAPGYVDQYAALVADVVSKRTVARTLSIKANAARAAQQSHAGDLGTATAALQAETTRRDAALAELEASARAMYMRGNGDLDGIIGLLASGPEQFLANADAWSVLSTAQRDSVTAYIQAARDVQAATVAVSSTQASVDADNATLTDLEDQLRVADAAVQAAQGLLQGLIVVSTPKVVVGADGCPISVPDDAAPAGLDVHALCLQAMMNAGTIQAASAVQWALSRLGAPYACSGEGRMDPYRFDCSSFVSRAYAQGAGLATANSSWAPSTRDMVPWDRHARDAHYVPLAPQDIKPGDLVLYDTCPASGSCPYRHVVMYLGPLTPGGPAYMVHTNMCGGVAHIEEFTGTHVSNLLGVRRVAVLAGEQPIIRVTRAAPAALLSALGEKSFS